MSAAAARAGTGARGLTLEQPLRAESGTGTLRLETGELENGRRRYDEHRVRLEPDAREIPATLRHEREAAGGRIAVQVVRALNANHTPGQSWTDAVRRVASPVEIPHRQARGRTTPRWGRSQGWCRN